MSLDLEVGREGSNVGFRRHDTLIGGGIITQIAGADFSKGIADFVHICLKME